MPPRPQAAEAAQREPGAAALRLMAIGWPSFLAACVLEVLVFALVDPTGLEWSGHRIGMSRQGIYSAAFFTFWGVVAAACGLTSALRMSATSAEGRPGVGLSSYKEKP